MIWDIGVAMVRNQEQYLSDMRMYYCCRVDSLGSQYIKHNIDILGTMY